MFHEVVWVQAPSSMRLHLWGVAFVQGVGVMDRVVPPPSPYIEALPSNGMVFGGGTFGRWLGG